MKCSKCGQNLEIGSRYCFKCGEAVGELVIKETVEKVEPKENIDYKSVLIATCVIVITMVILIVLFSQTDNVEYVEENIEYYDEYSAMEYADVIEEDLFIPDYLPGEENVYGISSENLSNGVVTAQGQYVYFILNKSIYKHKDGETPIFLTDATRGVFGINVCGDYIYYVEGPTMADVTNLACINRIRTDGSEKETIINDVASNGIFLVNNQYDKAIYYASYTYQNSSNPVVCLNRYDLEANECEEIFNSSGISLSFISFDEENQILYFTENLASDGWGAGPSIIEFYNIATGEFGVFLQEAQSRVTDIFMTQDIFVLEETDGAAGHLDMLDEYGNFILNRVLERNFRGIILANNGEIIFRQSSDVVAISIDAIKNTSEDEYEYGIINLAEVEGARILVKNDNALTCGVVGNWFYYMPDDNMFCRIKLDGTDWEMLVK